MPKNQTAANCATFSKNTPCPLMVTGWEQHSAFKSQKFPRAGNNPVQHFLHTSILCMFEYALDSNNKSQMPVAALLDELPGQRCRGPVVHYWLDKGDRMAIRKKWCCLDHL